MMRAADGMATTDDVPVVVFQGELQDATFLVSLLESGGIVAKMVTGVRLGVGVARIFVLKPDEAAARDLVADFELRRDRTGRS